MKILKNTGCFKILKPKGINATEIMVFSVTCRYCAVNIINPPPASIKQTHTALETAESYIKIEYSTSLMSKNRISAQST